MSKESGDFSVYAGIEAFLVHDHEGHFCGRYASRASAQEAADRWNQGGGTNVLILWSPPMSDYGGDRGTYGVGIHGTKFHRHCHSMEHAAAIAGVMRDLLSNVGLDTFLKQARIFATT